MQRFRFHHERCLRNHIILGRNIAANNAANEVEESFRRPLLLDVNVAADVPTFDFCVIANCELAAARIAYEAKRSESKVADDIRVVVAVMEQEEHALAVSECGNAWNESRFAI